MSSGPASPEAVGFRWAAFSSGQFCRDKGNIKTILREFKRVTYY